MIHRWFFACAALLVAFYMETFLLPSIGFPWRIHLTGLALVIAVRPFPLPAVLALGFLTGCLLAAAGTLPAPVVFLATLLAASLAWWVNRHAISQRSLWSVGVVATCGLLVVWAPEMIWNLTGALSRGTSLLGSIWPYVATAFFHGLLVSVVAYPFVMRARLRDARLESRTAGW